MGRQECSEICLGNAHQPIDLVRYEKSRLNPAPNSARRSFHVVGDLFDRVELPKISSGRLSSLRPHLEIDDPIPSVHGSLLQNVRAANAKAAAPSEHGIVIRVGF